MAASRIVQLRQLLREKFPGLATRADELPARQREGWATGLPALDAQLGGGFPRRAISEIVAPQPGCGSALLMLNLLRRVAQRKEFAALVDGRDSFDAAAVEQSTLDHLLWVRCHDAAEALKSADLLLRDGNLHVVLLDLVMNPLAELRRIPSSTWFRFQRLVEESQAVVIALTPHRMISPAEVHLQLRSRFGLDAVEADQVRLTLELQFEVVEAEPLEEPLRKSA